MGPAGVFSSRLECLLRHFVHYVGPMQPARLLYRSIISMKKPRMMIAPSCQTNMEPQEEPL